MGHSVTACTAVSGRVHEAKGEGGPTSAPSVRLLPHHVLGAVFAFASPRCLRTLSRVCRAWRHTVQCRRPLQAQAALSMAVTRRVVKFFRSDWGERCVLMPTGTLCHQMHAMRFGEAAAVVDAHFERLHHCPEARGAYDETMMTCYEQLRNQRDAPHPRGCSAAPSTQWRIMSLWMCNEAEEDDEEAAAAAAAAEGVGGTRERITVLRFIALVFVCHPPESLLHRCVAHVLACLWHNVLPLPCSSPYETQRPCGSSTTADDVDDDDEEVTPSVRKAARRALEELWVRRQALLLAAIGGTATRSCRGDGFTARLWRQWLRDVRPKYAAYRRELQMRQE